LRKIDNSEEENDFEDEFLGVEKKQTSKKWIVINVFAFVIILAIAVVIYSQRERCSPSD